jgi:hypothetical protein
MSVKQPIKLKYTPYLGKTEPVTEVIMAEVVVHEKHIELKVAYNYTARVPADTIDWIEKPDTVREHSIWPKDSIMLRRTVATHNYDTIDPESTHIIEVVHNSNQNFWIRANEKEIAELYKTLRAWLLS